MPLFEVGPDGLIPLQQLSEASGDHDQAIEDALWRHPDPLYGGRLLRIQQRPSLSGGGRPTLIAIDRSGRIVVVHARLRVDRNELAECLEYIGWARAASLEELAALYWRGDSVFWTDWKRFAADEGIAAEDGEAQLSQVPRMVLVAGTVAARAAATFALLAESGLPLTIVTMTTWQNSEGGLLLDVQEPAGPELVPVANAPAAPAADGAVDATGARPYSSLPFPGAPEPGLSDSALVTEVVDTVPDDLPAPAAGPTRPEGLRSVPPAPSAPVSDDSSPDQPATEAGSAPAAEDGRPAAARRPRGADVLSFPRGRLADESTAGPAEVPPADESAAPPAAPTARLGPFPPAGRRDAPGPRDTSARRDAPSRRDRSEPDRGDAGGDPLGAATELFGAESPTPQSDEPSAGQRRFSADGARRGGHRPPGDDDQARPLRPGGPAGSDEAAARGGLSDLTARLGSRPGTPVAGEPPAAPTGRHGRLTGLSESLGRADGAPAAPGAPDAPAETPDAAVGRPEGGTPLPPPEAAGRAEVPSSPAATGQGGPPAAPPTTAIPARDIREAQPQTAPAAPPTHPGLRLDPRRPAPSGSERTRAAAREARAAVFPKAEEQAPTGDGAAVQGSEQAPRAGARDEAGRPAGAAPEGRRGRVQRDADRPRPVPAEPVDFPPAHDPFRPSAAAPDPLDPRTPWAGEVRDVGDPLVAGPPAGQPGRLPTPGQPGPGLPAPGQPGGLTADQGGPPAPWPGGDVPAVPHPLDDRPRIDVDGNPADPAAGPRPPRPSRPTSSGRATVAGQAPVSPLPGPAEPFAVDPFAPGEGHGRAEPFGRPDPLSAQGPTGPNDRPNDRPGERRGPFDRPEQFPDRPEADRADRPGRFQPDGRSRPGPLGGPEGFDRGEPAGPFDRPDQPTAFVRPEQPGPFDRPDQPTAFSRPDRNDPDEPFRRPEPFPPADRAEPFRASDQTEPFRAPERAESFRPPEPPGPFGAPVDRPEQFPDRGEQREQLGGRPDRPDPSWRDGGRRGDPFAGAPDDWDPLRRPPEWDRPQPEAPLPPGFEPPRGGYPGATGDGRYGPGRQGEPVPSEWPGSPEWPVAPEQPADQRRERENEDGPELHVPPGLVWDPRSRNGMMHENGR